jgi:hypothetical protein
MDNTNIKKFIDIVEGKLPNEEQVLLAIAKKHFMVDTLETRNMDSLDFHEVSVWSIKNALKEAFEAGKALTK